MIDPPLLNLAALTTQEKGGKGSAPPVQYSTVQLQYSSYVEFQSNTKK